MAVPPRKPGLGRASCFVPDDMLYLPCQALQERLDGGMVQSGTVD